MKAIRPFPDYIQSQIDLAWGERNHKTPAMFIHRGPPASSNGWLFGKFFDQIFGNTAGGETTVVHQVLHCNHTREV